MNDSEHETAAAVIAAGRATLGIELGSTRIKACLIGDDPTVVLATGSHEWENQFEERSWTYSLDSVWEGLQAAYADLASDVQQRFGHPIVSLKSIGISAMMHGYLAFGAEDNLLVPFRTWRNTSTGVASRQLSDLFGVNIPLRWSIAHLHQAVLDEEAHVPDVNFVTTLAGYVHWQLTGRKVVGIGDASGMFPIDPATHDYDSGMLARYEENSGQWLRGRSLKDVFPTVLVAGEHGGDLHPQGAALLDLTGTLQSGAPMCPPEGDAGTGMVATNSVAARTGNVSAGTSIFAMIVLERPLASAHHEIDVVTTPAGKPVAMVHCNNGASELAAWANLFARFAQAAGTQLDTDAVYDILFREVLEGEANAGGLLAYNYLAGEPITGLDEGRPLVVRTPDSRFTLANFMRSQLYSVYGTLALGMQLLAEESVSVDTMFAHGGMFRTAGVAQQMLAGALGVPVAVAESASEGGAWGMAVLAAFMVSDADGDLESYLRDDVFGAAQLEIVSPRPADVAGFAEYLAHYRDGLAIEKAAIAAL
ncbi:MAG: xylulokinase [Actinomycetales bacterium]|tara:strand:- start:370 stop:1974 length:1605 start_codon:yes stop_codon:yes gene_type:complete